MNVRQAILAAADHIEANPDRFDFGTVKVPECGTPGCAIGWISFYRGSRASFKSSRGEYHVFDELEAIGVHQNVFYVRMDELVHYTWRTKPGLCVRGLRLYADKYHPAESSEEITPELRAELQRIFAVERVA